MQSEQQTDSVVSARRFFSTSHITLFPLSSDSPNHLLREPSLSPKDSVNFPPGDSITTPSSTVIALATLSLKFLVAFLLGLEAMPQKQCHFSLVLLVQYPVQSSWSVCKKRFAMSYSLLGILELKSMYMLQFQISVITQSTAFISFQKAIHGAQNNSNHSLGGRTSTGMPKRYIQENSKKMRNAQYLPRDDSGCEHLNNS